MSLTLYFHPLSSFCQKALIALYENGTPFTPHFVDLGDGVRVAFFMPHHDLDDAVDSLRGHLENIYPSGFEVGEVWRDLSADVTYVNVDVAELSLPMTG